MASALHGPEDLTLNREFAGLTRLVDWGEPRYFYRPSSEARLLFVLSPTVGLLRIFDGRLTVASVRPNAS